MLTKAEFVAALKDSLPDVFETKVSAEKAYDTFCKIMADGVANGQGVRLPGVGGADRDRTRSPHRTQSPDGTDHHHPRQKGREVRGSQGTARRHQRVTRFSGSLAGCRSTPLLATSSGLPDRDALQTKGLPRMAWKPFFHVF